MGYRQVYIKKAHKLSSRHHSLVIQREEEDEVIVPFEDIASILLEDNETVVTSSLMSDLSKNYITLMLCDKQHLPSSILMPMNMHYRQLKVLKMQLEVKKPLESQLWASIVKTKINNQIITLQLCGANDKSIDMMKKYVKEVQSGDKTNREAVCAKIFFTALYGRTFTRNHNGEDSINMALNYGYGIMAANLSRLFSMYGFQTMIGLHHCSETNSFNLSYDFVEVFRSVVDIYVFQHKDELCGFLTKEIRLGLIDLLQESILFDGKYYSVQNAMEEMILSFIKCLDRETSEFFKLPMVIVNEARNSE